MAKAKKKAAVKKTVAKKAPAKKTTAKKVAKKAPVKKTVAKKAPAKKTAAKKVVAKKTAAKKAVAKKAPAKKTVAKKTAAKKAPAKKTVAKKTAAKKVAAKKAPAKKVVAKKAPVKKTTAKKVAAKKAPAKKVVAKKAPVKKTTAKKVGSKKASSVAAKVVNAAKDIVTKVTGKKTKNKEEVKPKKGKNLEEEKVKALPIDEDEDDGFEDEKASKKSKGKRASMDEDDFSFDDEDFAMEDDLDFEKGNTKISAADKKKIKELQSKINEEIESLSENFSWEEIADSIATLDFFVDHRSDDCAEKGCDNLRTTQNYCRLHYISNWYTIQKKREILSEGKLQTFIEELIAKYPTKLIETIVSDLEDEKDFYRALRELNISSELEFDDAELEGSEDDEDDDDIAVEARHFNSSRYDDEG